MYHVVLIKIVNSEITKKIFINEQPDSFLALLFLCVYVYFYL